MHAQLEISLPKEIVKEFVQQDNFFITQDAICRAQQH
jgi:hypothetical protein